MGADLIVEWIVFEENANLDKIKADMLNAVNNLSEKDKEKIKNFYEEVTGETFEDIDIAEVKKEFTEIINDTSKRLDGSRDVTYINHKGENLFITGGMSWGDSPTDSYDLFRKYNLLLEILK